MERLHEVRYFLGVDPGASGAIAAINIDGVVIAVQKLKNATDTDIKFFFKVALEGKSPIYAALEKVHAMPKQGVSSTFKFGQSFGALQAHLAWAAIPWEFVTPHKWQSDLKCLTRGDKNVTKAKAQQMFPGTKITHANADALLLAEWARQRGSWARHEKGVGHGLQKEGREEKEEEGG